MLAIPSENVFFFFLILKKGASLSLKILAMAIFKQIHLKDFISKLKKTDRGLILLEK